MAKKIITSERRKLVKSKDFCRFIWDMRLGETIIINPHYLTHSSNEWLYYFHTSECPTLKLLGKEKYPDGTVLYVYRKVRGI